MTLKNLLIIILILLKAGHAGHMTNTGAIAAVVRYAVETAHVEWLEDDQGTRLGEVHFAVSARGRIQQTATTTERLVQLAEACDEELFRQIRDVESIDGAAASLRLKEALPSITHPRRRWIMDHDGMFRPDC